jgi:hypothetical protein
MRVCLWCQGWGDNKKLNVVENCLKVESGSLTFQKRLIIINYTKPLNNFQQYSPDLCKTYQCQMAACF